MELKRHFSAKTVLIVTYFVCLLAYFIYGLGPAGAKNYDVSANLSIPSIGLNSDVTTLKLNNYELETPDTIVGSFSNHSNKTLLIGHSTTVFQDLHEIELGDQILYADKTYVVKNIETLAKNEISMDEILKKEEKDTIVIMTCAGTLLDGGDASHRLIVTAN